MSEQPTEGAGAEEPTSGDVESRDVDSGVGGTGGTSNSGVPTLEDSLDDPDPDEDDGQ